MKRNYEKNKKYTIVKQLGDKGKEARTFLIVDKNNKEYAMKTFRKNKPIDKLKQEYEFQKKVAKQGLSPQVIECNTKNKYIIMEKLDYSLLDIINKQKGKLHLSQQKQIINIYKKLDEIGIYHADSNVLNIMCKDKKFYIIDYGFSTVINDKLIKKYKTNKPNAMFMPLGLLIQLKEMFPDSEFPYIEKNVKITMLKRIV